MGREAKTAYRSGRDRAEVRAHLDSEALELTGGKKLKVPLTGVRKATVEGDALKIETKTEKFELALGVKEAAAWAKKILNPPTLADKLGLKAGTKVLIVGERIKEIDEAAAKADRATTLTAAKAKAANVVLLTLAPETAAKQIAAAANALPKGLKDTKVARISVTHAALRFIAA
jgi:phage-related tail fiber protein